MARDKMSPERKEKLTRLSMVLGLILVVVAMVGTTLAIFFHEQEQETNINFGVIQLAGENSYFANMVLDKIIPGGKMTNEISISKTTISAPLYVRVKVDFEIPSYEPIRLEEELAILNASNFNESTTAESPYMWSDKQADGYYYLIQYDHDATADKNEIDLYALVAGSVEFTSGLYLPHSFEQEIDDNGNVISYGANIYISLCVEAIQAENIPEESQKIRDIAKYFDAKKLPFSFRYGIYENNSKLINYFGYDVGNPLPTITNGNKKLVWFSEETCSGLPLPSTTTIEENGVYYGAWFYTGADQNYYNFNLKNGYVTIDGYTGYEENIIVPNFVNYSGTFVPVTEINSLSGANNTSLKRVIIQDGVTTIRGGAFSTAYQLTSLVLPSTLTTIGGASEIYSTATSIFNETKCDVTRLVLPASVNTIFENALKTVSLSRVTFEGTPSVSSVSSEAFLIPGPAGTNVHNPYLDIIASNAGSLKTGALASLPIYTEASTPFKKTYYGGAYYIKQKNANNEDVALLVEFNRVLRNFIIPPYAKIEGEKLKVERVAQYVAYGYQKVTEIIISEGIVEIGKNAFAYCSNLLDIDLPNSLEIIADRSFEECVNLFDITMSRGLKSIGDYAFKNVNKHADRHPRRNAVLKPIGQATTVSMYSLNNGVYTLNTSEEIDANTPAWMRNGYNENSEYTLVVFTNKNGVEKETYVKTACIDPKQSFTLHYDVEYIGNNAFDGLGFEIAVFKFNCPSMESMPSNIFGTAGQQIVKTLYVPRWQADRFGDCLEPYITGSNKITIVDGLPN